MIKGKTCTPLIKFRLVDRLSYNWLYCSVTIGRLVSV